MASQECEDVASQEREEVASQEFKDVASQEREDVASQEWGWPQEAPLWASGTKAHGVGKQEGQVG